MKTVGQSCDFGALPYLIIISQIIVPLAVGIPVILMIPNVLQTEQMIDWEKENWLTERGINWKSRQHATVNDDEEKMMVKADDDLCDVFHNNGVIHPLIS